MTVNISKKLIEGEVSIQHKTGAEVKETEKLGELLTVEPMANVGYEVAYTKNLGNYENVKLRVSLHYPCLPDEIDETFALVEQWVDKKMIQITDELESNKKEE